jgi:hypothetical protein
LLGGVVALEGSWVNGQRLLAISNYARMNRVGQGLAEERGAREQESIIWLQDGK